MPSSCLPRSPRPVRALGPRLQFVLLVFALAGVVVVGRPGPAGADGHYRPPVEAPITDPFRAPANPYGPGNRGIEYATTPGTLVLAAGAGQVVFAGSVAGGLFVTILHPDGIRTSYSWLAAILVGVGASVGIGQPVGVAGPIFQISARRGDTYIDPASLWGTGPPDVYLVQLDGGPDAVDPFAGGTGGPGPAPSSARHSDGRPASAPPPAGRARPW